jgi:hypothetical protein
MAIEIQVHARNPSSPAVAHLSLLVDREDKEGEKRRAAWHWLNSLSAL